MFLSDMKMGGNIVCTLLLAGKYTYNWSSVVPRARHCGIPAILPPMSLKNAPSAGLKAHLENQLIIFRCFLLFPYVV